MKLLVLLLIGLHSGFAAQNPVEVLYCNRIVNSDTLWRMGEKLDHRYHHNESILKRDLPSSQKQRFYEQRERILRAFKSAEKAWRNPEDKTLVNEAVADFVAVFDRVHYRQASNLAPHLKTESDRIEEARNSLLILLNWGSQQEKAFNSRRDHSFTFDFGISSWEEVLLSWAIKKPISALDATPRNSFDTSTRQSLFAIIRHDTRHYRDFLNSVQGNEPTRYFKLQSELNKQELEEFRKKLNEASFMILRALEIMQDETVFPTKKERHLARAIAFEAIHEHISPISNADSWIYMDESFRKTVQDSVLYRSRQGFYGHFLKSLPSLSLDEISNVFEKIILEFQKQRIPNWIPPELTVSD